MTISVHWAFFAIIMICIVAIACLEEKKPDQKPSPLPFIKFHLKMQNGWIENTSDYTVPYIVNETEIEVPPRHLVRWKDGGFTYEPIKTGQ